MIDIQNLSKCYPGQSRSALEDISLAIPPGALFGLLGPNGAGKTTLLSLLVGLEQPDSGEIRFGSNEDRRTRPTLSLVPQGLAFYPVLSVRQNLAFFAAAGSVPRREQAARIEDAVQATELETYIDHRADTLSGGYQRRLNLAIGLLNQPDILFLDEPTVGLDPHARQSILASISALNRRGMTIIHTSHYMDEVEELCDRVTILDRGRIALQGRVEDLLLEGAEQRLRVHFSSPLEAARLDRMAAELGAHPSGRNGLEITGPELASTLNRLVEVAQREQTTIETIDYGRGNLEALYLSATVPRTDGTEDP